MKVLRLEKCALLASASFSVLAVTLPQAAYGQATSTASPSSSADTAGQNDELVVVGARQAEQSAIARKRNARTAQDSIVADDVGQFPDKNAAEAIARIAGVSLETADSGEQLGFNIRGQPADLIRIEVDGMSTLPAPFGAADTSGRAGSVAGMSSDLIKSVDVIKGQTADMSSGGVGGTVRIQQRNGLDFKKPLYRLNVQGMYHTLSKTVSPRINATATQKFFGGDVGLLLTGTYERQRFATDYSRTGGYAVFGDLDNSPEKTFTTPFDPAAAAVSTKAGCAALSTTGINSRRNCYAQWEDYLPIFVRPGRQLSDQKLISAQARVDWRVDRDMTVFASFQPNFRNGRSQDYNFSLTQPTGSTSDTGVLSSNVQNAKVNENHFVTSYDLIRGPGLPATTTVNPSINTQNRDIIRHSREFYTQTGFDWTPGTWNIQGRVQYSLAKSDRADRAFSFIANVPKATLSMLNNGQWTIDTPGADLLNPASYYPNIVTGSATAVNNGRSDNQQSFEYSPFAYRNTEWNYQLDVEKSFRDFPITRVKVGVQRRKRDSLSYGNGGYTVAPGVVVSRAAANDLLVACDPALVAATNPCVFGSIARPGVGNTNQRDIQNTITLAQYRALIDASLMELPGGDFFSGTPSRGKGLMTTWGVVDMDKFFAASEGLIDRSRYNLDCLYECIASDGKTYKKATTNSIELLSSAYAMADFALRPFGVLVDGNAGVRYQQVKVTGQPVIDYNTRVYTVVPGSAPGVTPIVRPNVTVTNTFIRRELQDVRRTNTDFLPSVNIALWPVEDQLALRYNWAKQRARPNIGQMTGSGAVTCGVIDPSQRDFLQNLLANNPGIIDDGDPNTDDDTEASNVINQFQNRCSGRIGNPELKGYGATTQNLSLEWYPNKDTQLSAVVYQIQVKTGRPENFQIVDYQLGGQSYVVDTYRDGQGGLRQRGFEIAGRTAFTFLPSFLKHMGGGFNYSRTESNLVNTDIDPFTGIKLPPRGQSQFNYNANLWYDDGKLNARVAFQRRALYYNNFNANSSANNIPANTYGIVGNNATSYYKIAAPNYRNGVKSLDARAQYNITQKFSLFLEAKNILGTTTDSYVPDEFREIGEGRTNLFDSRWGNLQGRIFYGGVIVTF